MDVDGTLTDGMIYMGSDGEVFKAFNIKDGCGIHDILIPSGICPVIMTGRTSRILERRCAELGIYELHQGVHDKKTELYNVLKVLSADVNEEVKLASVAYIGDDINDLNCMNIIKENGGIVGCPQDAVPAVQEISDFISSMPGGRGAVREFIEWIIKKNNS